MSNSDTLIGIVQAAPAQNTAILLPEAGVRVTYRSLFDQISEMADGLASMGIGRGDRVATYLPNGLPAVTSFLAASVAGTAAPLNPGYREEEVLFYLEDTSAKLLLLTAGGVPTPTCRCQSVIESLTYLFTPVLEFRNVSEWCVR